MLETGLHAFVVSMMGKGVPAMLCGHQRQVKAALDQIKGALEPIVVSEYIVDLFHPSPFVTRPFKFDRAQLMLLSTTSITDFVVCKSSVSDAPCGTGCIRGYIKWQ